MIQEITHDGLLLCDIQANTFEQSIQLACSSEVFIRRFMNSEVATEFDSLAFLDDTKTIQDVYDDLKKQYGEFNYGSTKFSTQALFWIGYIYRYFCFTYNLSSKTAYKLIKPNELNEAYLPYHTLDPVNAIDRLLEEKNISFKDEDFFKRSYEIFKKNRL